MSAKRVLVTGGSRSIGRAIALRLAEAGWMVAISYVSDEPSAKDTVSFLGDRSAGIYRCDLSKPDQAPDLFTAALGEGRLDALVNNAGIYRQVPFLLGDHDAFMSHYRETFAVNFESPLVLSRFAAAHFAEQGGGKILNMASRVGFKAEANASIYAASKAALINLTRSLAVELAPKNVGIFGIAPGWVDTAMVRKGMEERLPSILDTLPLGRMASPQDCAAAAAFLMSDEASYLSGVVIDVNGASYFH